MKNYAMLSKNRVIGVLYDQETEPEWGPTPDGSPVIAVPCDDTVILGMLYNSETGEFYEYVPEPVEEGDYVPTYEERIEAKLDYLTMTK